MDVKELKQKFEELSEKKSLYETQKVRLEADLEAAKKRQQEILDTLQTEYNVSSLEEARNLFEEKKAEIEKQLNECADLLEVE